MLLPSTSLKNIPCSQQAPITRDKSLRQSHNAKHEHVSRQPYVRLELLQQDIRGDLKEHIGHEEDDECCDVEERRSAMAL
jgi:hypothetical protein